MTREEMIERCRNGIMVCQRQIDTYSGAKQTWEQMLAELEQTEATDVESDQEAGGEGGEGDRKNGAAGGDRQVQPGPVPTRLN